MYDPTYPLFPTFAFLGFIMTLIPLPWHLQAMNSGTCFFMFWTALACFNQFINSVVWANNTLNLAPIWCDISTRIILGASVGIPAASLCINRRLYLIASVEAVTITPAEKRRAVLIDSLICGLFPIIFIALQYIVQGHRFNVFEQIGCYPAIYNTLATYFLSNMWPIVLGLISTVYCVLALRSFIRRRTQFGQFLSSNKSLTVSRYFRLMALASTAILITTPLAIFIIWLNLTTSPLGPWRSWSDTHFAFSRVEQIPALIWRSNHLLVVSLELTRWATPVCAFVFFGFFGFADEAQRHYRLAFWALAKPFGYLPPTKTPGSSASIGKFHNPKPPAAPAYTPPSHQRKRPDSLTSSLGAIVDEKSGYDSSTQFSSPNDRSSFPSSVKDADMREHELIPDSPSSYYYGPHAPSSGSLDANERLSSARSSDGLMPPHHLP